MRLVHSIADLRAALNGQLDTAFVPTMGNLHAGHVSLVELARRHGQPVVASLFVNPLQFGAGEDFECYPRTLEADCEKLAATYCDLVFAPTVSEIYPEPQTFKIEPPGEFANDLCGARRPGHFSGVATVVLKLFNLVRPRTAIFGKKDFQQWRLIEHMVRQFNLPIDIVAGETLREADGLAMSSRNGYLSPAERQQAPRLYRELSSIVESIKQGERDFEKLASQATRHLKMAGWQVDYIAVREHQSLAPASESTRQFVVLGAAHLGATRLIDNIEFLG